MREWAPSVSGREHFAILAFAGAIESILITLIENAGMDTIDMLTEIRSKQSAANLWMGIDIIDRNESRRHAGQEHNRATGR